MFHLYTRDLARDWRRDRGRANWMGCLDPIKLSLNKHGFYIILQRFFTEKHPTKRPIRGKPYMEK